MPGYPWIVYSARATHNPEPVPGRASPLEYRVDVELSWKTRGVRRVQRFSVLLLRQVPFGERMRRLARAREDS